MKPNVVFLLTDDQRYNTVHALGNKEIKTPNMDWLVENGTAFTNAHIPGGTVGAVCMPSRAMINTGKHLFHLEKDGQTIPQCDVTLGEWFKNQNYHCYGTGKWHNSPNAFTRSFHDGDNAFFGGMWDHWNVPINHYDESGEYDNVINFVADFHSTNKVSKIHCDEFSKGKHSSEFITDTCLKFINEYNDEKPYFLYSAYLAPHDPRTMPQKYLDMYPVDEISLPENYMPQHPFEFGVSDIRDEFLAPYPRSEMEVKRQIAEYYGMITHLDDEIGRIITAVREKGQLDNTIFILAGDNGLAMGSHGLFGKQNHYDHSIRIPLVFCGKGIEKAQVCDNYVYLMDIFPTLCEMLDSEIPSSVTDGISFAKMFEDAKYVTRDSLYFAYTYLLRAVKKDGFKLIEYSSAAVKTQLFDLENDPSELINLANKEDMKEKVQELRALMKDYAKNWEEEKNPLGKKFWDLYRSR